MLTFLSINSGFIRCHKVNAGNKRVFEPYVIIFMIKGGVR